MCMCMCVLLGQKEDAARYPDASDNPYLEVRGERARERVKLKQRERWWWGGRRGGGQRGRKRQKNKFRRI